MSEKPETAKPKQPSRREALRRLAGAVVAAYVVPEVLFLSAARAASTVSAPTAPSVPTPSVPTPDPDPDLDDATASSGSGASSAEQVARETCSISSTQDPNTISISRSDLNRSQQAVEAGYAKPLDQIWSTFISSYDGKIIGVEFLDRRSNPRYRFRAISKAGRLETVTISAQTGVIERIVGC